VEVPEGDLLIHAGDMTMGGHLNEVGSFARWFEALPHPHKVLVAGNHDFAFEEKPSAARALVSGFRYLEDEGALVAGLRLWGSPWTPTFGEWAFMQDRGAAIRAKWELIPRGLDVLITHGPPATIRDQTHRGEHVGCEDLRQIVEDRAPRVHVFGHIHEGYGRVERAGTTFVNAAICDVRYAAANQPLVVDL
jgi:Icc-related predicted phosphoesterase